MILEGWPEGEEPPARPTKKWEPATGRPGRGVKIILGELGFSSDLSTGKTIARKQQKYAALIRELEALRSAVLMDLRSAHMSSLSLMASTLGGGGGQLEGGRGTPHGGVM